MRVIDYGDEDSSVGVQESAIESTVEITEEPRKYTQLEKTSAALRKYNTVYSGANRLYDEAAELIEENNFNLADSIQTSLKNKEITEDDVEYFGGCKSRRQFDRIKTEIEDAKILDSGEWYENAVPMLIAGVSDPVNWIPVGRALKLSAGIGKMALESMIVSSASAGIRYASQETMKPEEVVYETAAAGMFTAALGGAARGIKNDTFRWWTQNLREYLSDKVDDAVFSVRGSEIFTEKISPALKKVSEKTSSFVREMIYNSPNLRGAMDEDRAFRDLMTSILRSNNIITKETREGATQILPAESLIDFTVNKWEGCKNKYRDIYNNFLKSEFAKSNNWKEKDFNLGVSRYIRNPSDDYVPEVKQAGEELKKFWSSLMDDALENSVIPTSYKEATKHGVMAGGSVLTKEEAVLESSEFVKKAISGELSESKITAMDHFSRIYDVDKIYKNENELKELLYKSVFKNNPHLDETLIKERVAEMMSHLKNTEISNRTQLSGFDFKGNIGGKFTEARSVAITDEVLEPFLVNNPLEIGDKLVRKLSGAIELNRVAKQKGANDWRELLESFANQRSIGNTFSGEMSKAYDTATKNKMQYLYDTADLLMGNYNKWDNPILNNTSKIVKVWNSTRHLGGILISSLCDISGVVSRFGLYKTFKGAVDAFKKDGIARNQAWEKIINASESAMLSSKMFDETYRDLGQKQVGKIGNFFMKVTGLPYWNDYWKKVTATLHYSDILEACIKPSKDGDLFLRQHRISSQMRDAISKQYEKFGYEYGANYILPLDRIADDQISKTLYSTLKTMADETVITVGAGDVPRFLRSGVGSALLQYKSFAFGYFNNIVLPQLIQKESRGHTLDYLISLSVLAPATQYLKQLHNGRTPNINSSEFWMGALRDSGLLGYILDTEETSERLWKDPERALSQVSPAIGLAADIVKTAKLPFQKRKATEYQLKKVKGLIPFNNLYYYNRFLNNGIRSYSKHTGRRLLRRSQ